MLKVAPAETAADEDPDSAAALQEIGVPTEQAMSMAPVADVGLQVWAWHATAVRLFQAMRTQWCAVGAGMGGVLFIGLNYSALPVVEQRLGLVCDEATFEALQTMEREGVRCFNADAD